MRNRFGSKSESLARSREMAKLSPRIGWYSDSRASDRDSAETDQGFTAPPNPELSTSKGKRLPRSQGVILTMLIARENSIFDLCIEFLRH